MIFTRKAKHGQLDNYLVNRTCISAFKTNPKLLQWWTGQGNFNHFCTSSECRRRATIQYIHSYNRTL